MAASHPRTTNNILRFVSSGAHQLVKGRSEMFSVEMDGWLSIIRSTPVTNVNQIHGASQHQRRSRLCVEILDVSFPSNSPEGFVKALSSLGVKFDSKELIS